jgi:hypothetical protein
LQLLVAIAFPCVSYFPPNFPHFFPFFFVFFLFFISLLLFAWLILLCNIIVFIYLFLSLVFLLRIPRLDGSSVSVDHDRSVMLVKSFVVSAMCG